MNTDARGYFYALTEPVLGAVFEVSNTLGSGFLEKVCQRALVHEFRLPGIRAVAEVPFPVTYKGRGAGEYSACILVEDVGDRCVETLRDRGAAPGRLHPDLVGVGAARDHRESLKNTGKLQARPDVVQIQDEPAHGRLAHQAL